MIIRKTSGYVADADLGLGCDYPHNSLKLKKGDTVVDLGSGAGNDCFVARNETGNEGKSYRHRLYAYHDSEGTYKRRKIRL